MTKAETNSYFKNVQALRAIAALLVLAFHIYAVEAKYFGRHAVPEVLGLFGTCGVDLFFLISGFVMTTVTRGQFGSRAAAVTFFKRRLLRIYPIYWFYSLVVLAVLIVMPQWVNASAGHHADVLRSFLLLPSDSLPLLLQGWTLRYEMFLYVVFTAIVACVAERFLAVTLLAWAAVTCTLFFGVSSSSIASPTLALVRDPLVLEFIAGCYCALAWKAMSRPLASVLFAVGVAGFAVSFAIGERVGLDTVVQWRTLYFGIPAFFVLLGAVSLERYARVAAPRLLCALGDASYSLYLSHVLVISAVARFYARFALPALGLWVGTALCFAIAIAAGYLSYRVIERPLNELFKRVLLRSGRVSVA